MGSFLNVVIYRLPRDLSLIRPGSHCPICAAPIRFYDNIPLLSWLLLKARCRHCKAPISPRYFVVELLTGLVFSGLYSAYFLLDLRQGLGSLGGAWFLYLLHITLLAAFLAASVIDLQLWVIPLSLCWFVTAAGLVGSATAGFVIDPGIIKHFRLLPYASVTTAALAVGAALGTSVSLLLVATGIIRRSYQSESPTSTAEPCRELPGPKALNHRREIFNEIVFLLPIILGAAAALAAASNNQTIKHWWLDFSQLPVIKGLLGSLWGYLVGCGVVWATRIAGTLAFGKEAMGLGDVHLMGAAGAVIGPVFVVIAFFIAPFFGLAWALYQMFFKKTRQIPYGPFLSMAVFTVMIFHDQIINLLALPLVW